MSHAAPETKARQLKRLRGVALHRMVLRWANMEMAKRTASLTDKAAGDAMDDDCQTALLEMLQAARPRKWAIWRKKLEAQNDRTEPRRETDL